jgi:hypothetical protein
MVTKATKELPQMLEDVPLAPRQATYLMHNGVKRQTFSVTSHEDRSLGFHPYFDIRYN